MINKVKISELILINRIKKDFLLANTTLLDLHFRSLRGNQNVLVIDMNYIGFSKILDDYFLSKSWIFFNFYICMGS